MTANDLIILYTDGLYEVIRVNNQEYGQERLLEAAQFIFCKLIEHQTEGGVWFSMLR